MVGKLLLELLANLVDIVLVTEAVDVVYVVDVVEDEVVEVIADESAILPALIPLEKSGGACYDFYFL